MTQAGGSVIDFFVNHKKLANLCKVAKVFNEGYTAPHRPVEMLIMGQQALGQVEVHKRPPALREPMGFGPFRIFDGRLAAAFHQVTVFMGEQGIEADAVNRSKVMTDEVDHKLSGLFEAWYHWAETELEQRFGFAHTPERQIEVKKVEARSLLATQRSGRPMPPAAPRVTPGS